MDMQSIMIAGLGIACTVLGWFARELWAAVKELKTDLANLRAELPKEYVAKSDFRDALTKLETEMRSGFQRLFDKLDGKADK